MPKEKKARTKGFLNGLQAAERLEKGKKVKIVPNQNETDEYKEEWERGFNHFKETRLLTNNSLQSKESSHSYTETTYKPKQRSDNENGFYSGSSTAENHLKKYRSEGIKLPLKLLTPSLRSPDYFREYARGYNQYLEQNDPDKELDRIIYDETSNTIKKYIDPLDSLMQEISSYINSVEEPSGPALFSVNTKNKIGEDQSNSHQFNL